ncbi:MAG: phosphodiester glycosidase family protein [Bacteroidales bacterium]|nr:phosphodiester glycosidase family protein [Bacteroidales bacterium]MDT8372711.1 phosphodiester glycosidase family protein [Bacteroidales bacterium]
MMKRNILTLGLALSTLLLPGQPGVGYGGLTGIDWQFKSVSEGVTLSYVNYSLFNSVQAIYVVDVDTSAAKFEFGVAVPDSRMATSAIARQEGVLAAINGTFFNMREGYNVHYVRVDDSLIAVTDEGEFGIRATGVFTATGEIADILPWGPEREDAGAISAKDAIVSGPLLIDDSFDMPLDSINFNTVRHPRTMVGITGSGHLLFVVVDGRQPGYADGMSLFELRALARSLGCSDALNLDGGGSTTLVVAGEGSNGVVNRPSGKVQRPVPSILFVRQAEKDCNE